MSDCIPAPVVSQPARLVECVAGLRPIRNSPQNCLFVRSPKTGREIEISHGFFPQLREHAPRLIGRIAQARSVGVSVVFMSIVELQALVTVENFINEKCKPLPRGPKTIPAVGSGWRRRIAIRGR